MLRVDLRVDRVAVLAPPSSFSSGLADAAAARVLLRDDDAVLPPSPSFLAALLVLLRDATLPSSSLLSAPLAPLLVLGAESGAFFFAPVVAGFVPSPSTSVSFSRVPSSGTVERHGGNEIEGSKYARGRIRLAQAR